MVPSDANIQNAKYLRIMQFINPDTLVGNLNDLDDNLIQLEKGNKRTAYEPYYITPTTNVTQSSNHTLKAKWVADEYTITLDANGGTISSNANWTGSGATATKTVSYDSPYGTLPTSTGEITKSGYTLTGWYTQATGGDKIEENTIAELDDDITIYAHWTDTTNPILSLSKITYVTPDLSNTTTGITNTYTYMKNATVSTENGVPVLTVRTKTANDPNPYSPADETYSVTFAPINVNGGFWYFSYDSYVATAAQDYTPKGGIVWKSYFYDATVSNRVPAINGYKENQFAKGLYLNTWNNNQIWHNNSEEFKKNGSYGTDVKNVLLQLGNSNTSSSQSIGKIKIRNLKIYGEAIPNSFYLINVTAEDNDGIATLKYAKGNLTAGYFTSNGTSIDNYSQIRVTENATYTVYAKDNNGNATVKTIVINTIV